MTIHKVVDFSKPYTINYNTICQSKISLEAKGLYLHLSSLPSDWDINKEFVKTFYQLGRRKVDRIFKELFDCGLLETVLINPSQGQFSKRRIILNTDINSTYELPQKQYKGTKEKKQNNVTEYTIPNKDASCEITQLETEQVIHETCNTLPDAHNVSQIKCNTLPETHDELLQSKEKKTITKSINKKNIQSYEENDFVNKFLLGEWDDLNDSDIACISLNKDLVNQFEDKHIFRVIQACKRLCDASKLNLLESEYSDFVSWYEYKLQNSPRASQINSFSAVAKKALRDVKSSKRTKRLMKDLLAFKTRFFYEGDFLAIDASFQIKYKTTTGCTTFMDYNPDQMDWSTVLDGIYPVD